MVSQTALKAYPDVLAHIFGAHPAPPELQSCAWFESARPGHFFVCGDFLLLEEPDHDMELWFGDPARARRAGEQLTLFMSDGDTALYGFWRYQGQPLAEAPIVYLDDEGANNSVVASTLREFLSLIAVGYERISFKMIQYYAKNPQRFKPYNTFKCPLFAALQIQPAADPLAVVTAARKAHPDFDAWITELLTAE